MTPELVERETYIVVGKNKLSLDASWPSVVCIHERPVLVNYPPEDWPLNSTDQASSLPCLGFGSGSTGLTRQDLLVKELDHKLASFDPLVPILPHEGAPLALLR